MSDHDLETRVRTALEAAAASYRPGPTTPRRDTARRLAAPVLVLAVVLVAVVGFVVVNRDAGDDGPEIITADGSTVPGNPAVPTSGDELILVPPAPRPGETVAVYFPDGPVTWGMDTFELRGWDGQGWGDDLLAIDGLVPAVGFGGLAGDVQLPPDLAEGRWRLCASVQGALSGDDGERVHCTTFAVGDDLAERGRFLEETIPLAERDETVGPVDGTALDLLLAEAEVVAVVVPIATSPDGVRREDPGASELHDRITVAVFRTVDGILPFGLAEINHPALVELGDGTLARVPLPEEGDLAAAIAAIETGDPPTVLIGIEPDPQDPERWRIVRPDLVTIVDGIEDPSIPPLVDNNVVDRFCDELGGGTVCRVRIDELDSAAVDAVADPTAVDDVIAGSCSSGGAPGERWALCAVPLGGRQAVIGRDLDDADLVVRVQIGSVAAEFPLDSPPGVATLVDVEADQYDVLRDGVVVGGMSGAALLSDG